MPASPLAAEERDLLRPVPPGTTLIELENRLDSLQLLRVKVVRRMRAAGVTALAEVRHQAELLAISAEIQAVTLRLRARSVLAPITQRVRGA